MLTNALLIKINKLANHLPVYGLLRSQTQRLLTRNIEKIMQKERWTSFLNKIAVFNRLSVLPDKKLYKSFQLEEK